MCSDAADARERGEPDVHDAVAALNDPRVQRLRASGGAKQRRLAGAARQGVPELVHAPQLDAPLLACRAHNQGISGWPSMQVGSSAQDESLHARAIER